MNSSQVKDWPFIDQIFILFQTNSLKSLRVPIIAFWFKKLNPVVVYLIYL